MIACALKRSLSTIPPTMKAVVVRNVGDSSALEVDDAFPTPTVEDGQVLVENSFSGINFIDTYHRKGLYPRDLPFVGGQEGCGTIAQTTPSAEKQGFKVGDDVAYSVFGSYAKYTAVPCGKLLPVPKGVPMDVAACVPVQSLTAHYLVTDAHAGLCKEGDWMMIHGVGGGTCQVRPSIFNSIQYLINAVCVCVCCCVFF